ncbi:C45 family autoproteolytic acyltransferase/hydolase [Alkalicoccus urumqiensis]|uniref:Acyl-CoA--6-aminopenicillanic acid acyl-transferase n=1 Tax=Alkalicoccus urumqiensis TaxID=1548213 RepID=A0A2P6MKX0_ALKUR|nr:C45 family peptidase [Alkalicoccus urumqiensis]PRO66914.1 acyl-CoA--6-aminopenicillanic acid acyl-transferase [Alkalicoccus urumqiensis]
MDVQIQALADAGDAYQFGRRQAEQLKKTPLYLKHASRRKKSIRRYQTDLHEAKRWLLDWSPGLWEELHGLADGLEWRLEDVVHEYAGYQESWKKSGCSAMMRNGLYARNYDYHPKTYDGRFVLWKPSGGSGAAHIGFAQRMIGRMDGMNEHGLAIGYHFVNRIAPTDGWICCTLARIVLDQCRNVPEAEHLLKEMPHRHAFNYSLADRTGRFSVVEGSGQSVNVLRKSGGVCTNHFRTPGKLTENRHRTEESEHRLEHLKDLRHEFSDPASGYDFLNNSAHGIVKHDYRNWSGTIHTAVYDTVNLEVTAGIGPDAVPVTISLKKWLENGRFPVKKLRGALPQPDGGDHLAQQADSFTDNDSFSTM